MAVNSAKLRRFGKIFMILLFFPLACQAQNRNELGKPFLSVWLSKDYGAEASNWAIVQDDRGVMYFGNTSGILEYDGVSWRLIQFPNRSVCCSLAKDAKNCIYAGGVGDFGYLVPDRIGQMRFVSLLPKVPEEARDIADAFMAVPPQPGWVLAEEENGRVWTLGKEIALGTRQAEGSYQWRKAPFRRFSTQLVSTIYPEDTGVAWFGGNDGLIRYDANVPMSYAADYPALVRRVAVGEDALIFGGAVGATGAVAPTMPYAHNNLRFAYSASAYEDASRLQFQTWLEGFDEQWSNWNSKTEREYTNLPEGNYHFRVRAKAWGSVKCSWH